MRIPFGLRQNSTLFDIRRPSQICSDALGFQAPAIVTIRWTPIIGARFHSTTEKNGGNE